MNDKITKQEIIDWIDFLYKDLLTHYVYIGGFYFTFDQLDEFFLKLTNIERQIRRVNNTININSSFIKIPLLKDHVSTLEKENKLLRERITFITDKITAVNKQHEKVEVHVTYEDLQYVYDNLAYLKDELDTFSSFLLEELQKVKSGEENNFFVFVNDTATELKNSLMYGLPKKVKNNNAVK